MARAEKKDRAPTVELLTYFDRCHVERFGVRAVIRGGKDAKLLAALCKSHGADAVRDLIAEFFRSRDPWVRSRGYTVGVFYSMAGALILHHRRPKSWLEDCDHLHGGTCRDHVAHFWRVLRDTGE